MSTERTWREALEAAAELLMDHGVVTTGPELEKVCEQIRSLPRPVQDSRKRVIRAELSGCEIQAMTPSKGSMDQTVLSYLRAKGIPIVEVDKMSRQFVVARGRIEYWHDLLTDVHRFHWEELVEDEVPF